MARTTLPKLTPDELQDVYNWVDEAKLSRPKKSIARDFADGGNPYSVLAAEVVKHFMPAFIDLHNYNPAHSLVQKLANWNTMNRKAYAVKVFRRLGFQVERDDVERVIRCEPEAVERVLKFIKDRIQAYHYRKDRARAEEAKKAAQETAEQAELDAENQEPLLEALPQDSIIAELRETVEIMELKVKKLEQLVKLKDAKTNVLINRLAALGLDY